MRRKKLLFADISEYLRLHYTREEKPTPTPVSPDFAPHKKESRARGAYYEDSSVIFGVPEEEELSAPEPNEPEHHSAPREETAPSRFCPIPSAPRKGSAPKINSQSAPCYNAAPAPTAAYRDLNNRLNTLDESFQEALLRLIDERGMKDSTCYKRAGVDRKLFSKIRSNPAYRPSKATAVAFAIALELNLDETVVFLRKAGYALSHSAKFDVIVEYFIVKGRYNLRELNEALYEFDQPLVNG